MIELRGDAVLLGAAAVVASVRADDHLVGVLGDRVDEAPQPLGDPPGGVHRRELGHLHTVRVDVPCDEVAAEPDEYAADVGLIAFVLEAGEEPLLELVEPQLAYLKAVLVFAIDGLRQDALFAVNIRQHQHRGGVVLLCFDTLGQWGLGGLNARECRQGVAPLTLAVDLSQGRLVPIAVGRQL